MHLNFISIKMIVTFSLLFSVLKNSFPQTKFENRISGKVTDTETAVPIFNVNVFLANTTLGSTTDRDGYYLIQNIPPGAYDLIFSMMGYELEVIPVQFTATKSIKYDIKLRPRVLEGKTVEVVATEPKEWKKNLQRFIPAFIGESANAQKCKIVNPEVLDFSVNEKTNQFVATTDSIIIVENHSLGYRIHIILDIFRISKDSLIYSTYPRYEELIPEDKKQKKMWQYNRKRTYSGSFRHFISAVARDKLESENFYLFDLSGNQIRPDNLNIVPDTSLALKWLYFYDPIEVVYKGMDHAGEGKYFLRWGRRFPSSRLYLRKGYAHIDTLGNVLTKFAFIHSGYWFQERIADMLPFDFQYEESSF